MDAVQMVIQGGAVGIVIALLYYSWKKDQLYNKTLNNHLEHSYKADMELAKSITLLAERIDKIKLPNK